MLLFLFNPGQPGECQVFEVLIRPRGLISWLWFRSHCHCKMWHQLRDSHLLSTITFDHIIVALDGPYPQFHITGQGVVGWCEGTG